MFTCIEFDKERFPTPDSCKEWLSNSSEWNHVPKLTDFKLKSRKQSQFLTAERDRAVWTFSQDTWKYPHLSIDRPEVYVCIVKKQGTESFCPTDCPPLKPTTLKKEQEKQLKLEKKKERHEAEKKKKRDAREAAKTSGGDKGSSPKSGKRKSRDSPEKEEVKAILPTLTKEQVAAAILLDKATPRQRTLAQAIAKRRPKKQTKDIPDDLQNAPEPKSKKQKGIETKDIPDHLLDVDTVLVPEPLHKSKGKSLLDSEDGESALTLDLEDETVTA